MSATRKRRASGREDILAAEGLESWQAEPLADLLSEMFDTETSERHRRDGKLDVYVAPSKKLPDDELLAAFVQGALAMLARFELDDEDEEEIDEEEEDEGDEEPEDERPRRGRR
jgi:hypothetical protein